MPARTFAPDAAGSARRDGARPRTAAAGNGRRDDVRDDGRAGARRRPCPSGWTRLERRMTNVRELGSIQSEVPVNPVWPKEPGGKRSPRGDE